MNDFLRRYWRAIATLILTNILAWLGFERLVDQQLKAAELWAARSSLLSGLLLFDNLCVLWWYSDRTNQLAAIAQKQLHFQWTQWQIGNKPLVFLDAHRWTDKNGLDACEYVLHNVALGVAINMHVTHRGDDGRWIVEAFGALPSGGKLKIPGLKYNDPLRDHGGRMPGRIVIAEAIRSRSKQQWIVTVNVLDARGDVHHQFVDFDHRDGITLAQILDETGAEFELQIKQMRHALTASAQGIRAGTPVSERTAGAQDV